MLDGSLFTNFIIYTMQLYNDKSFINYIIHFIMLQVDRIIKENQI